MKQMEISTLRRRVTLPAMRNAKKRNTDKAIFERQSQIWKAFANPTRLHALHLLREGEWAASDLQKELAVSMTNLSQHIAILKAAGVVATQREGRKVYFSLAIPEVKQACQLIQGVLRRQIQESRRLAG